MRSFLGLFFVFVFTTSVQAGGVSEEAPIQHYKASELNSMAEAKKVFVEKTLEMKGKQALDNEELQQIHKITYSLEKSVAYFAERLTDKKQRLAKKIAVVVEDIHLNSENNRKLETERHLAQYFKLAGEFIYGHWDVNM